MPAECGKSCCLCACDRGGDCEFTGVYVCDGCASAFADHWDREPALDQRIIRSEARLLEFLRLKAPAPVIEAELELHARLLAKRAAETAGDPQMAQMGQKAGG